MSRTHLMAAVVLVTASARAAPPEPATAGGRRYDLRPGDHVVYRQRLDRDVTSPRGATTTRTEWTSHLLVIDEAAGRVQVGIQRNRSSLRVLRLREEGKDRGEAERRALEERLIGQKRWFSEANWVDLAGQPALGWSALREAPSELLPYIHEIEPLPGAASETAWTRTGALPLPMQTLPEPVDAVPGCTSALGVLKEPAFQLKVRICGGVLERLELAAEYGAPPNRKIHEELLVERVERKRNETVAGWLTDPDLRHGALSALFTSRALPVSMAELARLLDGSDVSLQRQVLSLALRCEPKLLPLERLGPLLQSPSPRVRALAVRQLASLDLSLVAPLLARAERDPDESVRRAAAAATAEPDVDPDLVRQAQAIRDHGPLPRGESCGGRGWAARALRAQRAVPQPPGTFLQSVRTPPFAGQPYLVRVPEDYRGDEPFPLLVYLSGGPGRAMTGALESAEVVDETGWLVAYPQARDLWWEQGSTAAFPAVLRDVIDTLNVDTNRVFLAGFSNGGTGALSYAARWPDRWAAVAPLMGGGFPFFGTEPPSAANLSRLPQLFLHGSADTVIPASATRETVRSLKRDHPDSVVEMEILEGRGHDVRLGADGPRVVGFLAPRAREPFPRRLVFETRQEHGRSFWIGVTRKKAGLARVEAALEDDGTIRIATRRVSGLRLLLRSEMLADPGRPVRVILDGREAFTGPLREDCATLLSSWQATGDPYLAHSFEIPLEVH